MTSLELLSPAKNADIGIAAIRCGADAVYIGGPSFGARAAAGNSVEDIKRLCEYAAPFNVRIYVTVNTLCEAEEKREAVNMMLAMKDIGVSAFILQDTSLLPLLKEAGPWAEEFHASTQCAIRTPERALELVSYGFTRLVLERALSLRQIRAIREAIPPETELECFVHGALCVCYSGECYLSEFLTGRSANKGECAQPCRGRYDLVDSSGRTICRNKPLLSLKDLCLINHLEELAEAGAVSFKIEGRLKNESYVKNVVRAYDIALNRLIDKFPDRYCRASDGKTEKGFIPDLNKTFNRGYTSLFINGERSREWNSGDASKGMGERIGTVARVSVSGQYFELDTGMTLSNGDGLCIMHKNGEVEGFRIDKAEGRRVFCKLPEGIKAGEEVWRNRDAAFEKELEARTPSRTIEIPVSLQFKKDSLIARARHLEIATMLPAGTEIADNQERMLEIIRNQISKTTAPYRFTMDNISAEGPLPFLNVAFLNAVRRNLAAALQAASIAERLHPGTKKNPEIRCDAVGGHPHREGELMRTKYCIRYHLGLCGSSEQLFLYNNGRKIPLHFDCSRCEMFL